jgi:hypothetical protein
MKSAMSWQFNQTMWRDLSDRVAKDGAGGALRTKSAVSDMMMKAAEKKWIGDIIDQQDSDLRSQSFSNSAFSRENIDIGSIRTCDLWRDSWI